MSYDGVLLRAVALDLNHNLPGARVDKIYQPTKNEVLLVLRKTGGNCRLLLSANARECGIYLTTQTLPNPQQPPLFCMVLRKHLEGSRIISVTQLGLERVVEISFDTFDELGVRAVKKIIVEIMGKHSNVILVNPSNNKIIDAVHRVTPVLSRYRLVLPGHDYQTPPPQNKIIPWEATEESFYQTMLSYPLSQTIDKVILSSFSGLGPQTVSEIIYRAGLSSTLSLDYCGEYELSKLWQAFTALIQRVKNGSFQPEVVVQNKKPLAFAALPLEQYPSEMRLSFEDINKALDFFHYHKKTRDTIKQKTNDLAQIIKKEIARCEKKAGLQLSTIQDAKDSEKYRLWGELLTANIYALSPGKSAEVSNFYSPEGETLVIPLKENLSIGDNAQRYFNKYRKAKNASQKAQIQYDETKAELDYLYSLLNSLEMVTETTELAEIRDELKSAGYVKASPDKKGKSQRQPTEKSTPRKVLLDSYEIYIGKNNKQNDLIVTKIAKPDDIWLHTKDIPGSHVLIKSPSNQPVPDHVLETAALLAAYHSKSRLSTNVPVDYTQKKHVWKLKGAKPGMVHYDHQQTINVTPDENRINDILAQDTLR